MATAKELMQAGLKEAQAALAAHEKKVSPIRAKLDAAAAEHERARLKWQAAKDELVPQLDKPTAVKLAQEVSALARALGGKTMSGG